LFEKKHKKDITKHNSCDGRVFQNAKVKQFLTKVDSVFGDGFVSLVSEFQNHSEPIVVMNKMNDLIREAKRVFGSTWNLFMSIRGHVNTKSGSKRDIIQSNKTELQKTYFSSCCT
jgi:hypothetical protein